jgi:hypothetical protein
MRTSSFLDPLLLFPLVGSLSKKVGMKNYPSPLSATPNPAKGCKENLQ